MQRLVERFMRTLKEECVHLNRFASLSEAKRIIGEFIDRYNGEWMIERHDYKTPIEARIQLTSHGCMIKQPLCPGNRDRYTRNHSRFPTKPKLGPPEESVQGNNSSIEPSQPLTLEDAAVALLTEEITT